MTEKIILPKSVSFIINRIRDNGHRADIVGGCTRDRILGGIPSDYDITTDATPDEVKAIFSGMRTVDTGIKHGTVTLMMDGEPYEITTYRLDGEYKDHRHPEKVAFTRLLSLDLERRDFTMNAICYNDTDGFTDLFGGREDIAKRLIRAVGKAEVRFEEDALRIFRAIRFASVLGFSIEDSTAAAARRKRELLRSVSAERIAVEWNKLLGGRCAYEVISKYSDIITTVIPELSELKLPKREPFLSVNDPLVRELALFKATLGADAAVAYAASADRLRYDNRRKKLGAAVLQNIDFCDTDADLGLKRMLMAIGAEYSLALLAVKQITDGDTKKAEGRLRELIEGSVYTLSALAINGNDLIADGVCGAEVGRLLNELLTAVVEGRCGNSKEELVSLLRSIRSKNGI